MTRRQVAFFWLGVITTLLTIETLCVWTVVIKLVTR